MQTVLDDIAEPRANAQTALGKVFQAVRHRVVNNNSASPISGSAYVSGTATGFGLAGNLASAIDIVASSDRRAPDQ